MSSLELSSKFNQISVIQEKRIFYLKFPPPLVQNSSKRTIAGWNLTYNISFSYITKNCLELELRCKYNIFYPQKKLFESGRTSL